MKPSLSSAFLHRTALASAQHFANSQVHECGNGRVRHDEDFMTPWLSRTFLKLIRTPQHITPCTRGCTRNCKAQIYIKHHAIATAWMPQERHENDPLSRKQAAQCSVLHMQSVAVQTVRGEKTAAPHLRAPTRPSIMSEGDTQSAPARACPHKALLSWAQSVALSSLIGDRQGWMTPRFLAISWAN